jgi:hypothetical protein
VTVVASAPNGVPTIASHPRTTIGLGDTYEYQVQASDTDSDPLTYTLKTAPGGMTIDGHGFVLWKPTPAQFGPNAVEVEVDDGRGGSAVQDFTINVVSHDTNQPPAIVSTPPLVATVGQKYSYNVGAIDPDGDPLMYALDQAPAGMTIDPSLGMACWMPTADEIGTQNVTVRVVDAQGAVATQSYTITVHGVDVPPVITSEPPTQAYSGVPYTYQVSASDAENNPLTFSLTTAPAGMTIDAATGLIRWTPDATQVGNQAVALQVDDGQGGTATQLYTLVVAATPPNQAPAITSTPPFQATVGQPYQYTVQASDPDGDVPVFGLQTSPAGMTIDPTTGIIRWTPTAAEAGTAAVSVTATDAGGLAGTQDFSITVLGANQPPDITSAPVTSNTVGLTYRYDVRASDPDGDPLTYALTTAPAGMTIDSFGRITWATGTADVSVHSVVLSVADDHGASVTQSYNLTVVPDTESPQVNLTLSANPADIGSQVTFLVSATDDVAVQALGLTVAGTSLTLDANGQAMMTATQAGNFTVVATATDPAGNIGTANATLTVIDPRDTSAPTVAIDAPAEGAVITSPVDVTGTASDSELLSYNLIDLSGGQFTVAEALYASTKRFFGS